MAVSLATVSILCSGPGGYPLLAKTAFNIDELTAGNIVAQKAAVQAVATAVQGLTLGVVSQDSIAVVDELGTGYPSSVANRGQKWVITCANGDGRLFTYTIPAADPAGNVNADNYTANLASTDWAAFVTAFEAVAVDPAGNALSVLRAKLGGRRR